MAVRIFPNQGSNRCQPALGPWGLNQWTSREVLNFLFIYDGFNTPSASMDLLKRIFFLCVCVFGLF